jgi:hypothetical protein
LGESGQSGLERETGAVCLVIGVSEDGIGRPATRAKQAAEKLNFAKSSKNGSRQNAPGTICGASVMVCYPLIFKPFAFHSGFFRSL